MGVGSGVCVCEKSCVCENGGVGVVYELSEAVEEENDKTSPVFVLSGVVGVAFLGWGGGAPLHYLFLRYVYYVI